VVEAYKNKLNLIIKQLDTNSGGPGKPRNTALNCKAVFLGLPGPPEFVSSCFIIKFNLFL
jgi:hypothetical protein